MTAQVNFRIEEDVKESAESALTAIVMFLTKVGREKRIPFEITADPFYSENNTGYIEKVAEDIRSGKAIFPNMN